MALSISQIQAASYPAVLASKPANQWSETSAMRWFEKMGFIKREDFGPTLEDELDYQRNPGTVIQSSPLQPLDMSETEYLTAASYTPAEVTAPIVWSKLTEVQNPTKNQKINVVKGMFENGIQSHDDILEQALFAASTNGFLGFPTHMNATDGQGSDGGIDAGANAFWRNQLATYVDDTDIEATFTTVWNACSKGSGSSLMPTLMVSDSTTNALFEGTQQALQRYDSQDFKAGAKSIMFKTANYIFSPFGDTKVYFMNPKSLSLRVSKAYFRDLSEVQPFGNANGFRRLIYSACQTTTNNRSRLGVAHT